MNISKTPSIERLKEELKKPRLEFDIVPAILSRMETQLIPNGSQVLHEIVFELKKDERFKSLLDHFNFPSSYITPYSKELDNVIAGLLMSRILHTFDLSDYYMNKSTKCGLLGECYRKFGKDVQVQIDQMAVKADQIIKGKIESGELHLDIEL